MTCCLRIDGLTKTYAGDWLVDSRRALDDVGFEIAPSERVGLLGPNGAGKTTTFKCVTGLVRPSSGRIELFGLPPRRREARARLGFLPENPNFHDFLTGEEFVDLAARLAGVPGGERKARVREVLDRVGLGEARSRRIRTYSKGMQQRVGIAQALVGRPELVILDEPMTGLDPIGRREVRDLVGGLAQEGTALLFSSHVLQDAELICERVIVLARGRVVRQATLDELLTRSGEAVDLTVLDLAPEAVDEAVSRLDAERVAAGPGGVVVTASGDDAAERARATLAEAGGRVTAIVPRRATLEDAFLRELGASSASREQGS